MSEMNSVESMERFVEGMKKAASRARELSEAQKNRNWNKIAFALEGLLSKGSELYKSRALTDSEVMQITEHRMTQISKDLNG